MFSTDQTHLRRYFATLGVAIAAGTLSLAGLFLKLQQDLLVTKSTLANVTPSAREALLRRQDYLTFGTYVLPWFVLVGLGGLGLSAYGLVGWARRQKIIDEREDIGLFKERAELHKLTEEEKAEKLDRDVEESAGEPPTVSAGEQLPTLPNRPETDMTRVRTEIVIIEGTLREKLAELYQRPDSVLTGVSVQGNSGQRLEIDAAVVNDPERPIFFEVKYAASNVNVVRQILAGLQKLTRLTTTVALSNARRVLVIIVTDDATTEQVKRWRTDAVALAKSRESVISVYVNRVSDFILQSARDFRLVWLS